MWKIKQIGLFVLCLCTLLLWYNTIIYQQQMIWFDNSISVYWENNTGVSPQQINKLLNWQKKDGGILPPLVLSKPYSNQMLYGDLYSALAIGEVLEYYGDISYLIPCQFQSGYWPEDNKGCVIDDGIAHTLWGSSDVLGRLIQWNGLTWYVRGVIKGTNNLAIFPTEKNNVSLFSNLWLDLSEIGGSCLFAEQLLQKYQLPLGTITDLGLFVWLAKIITTVPVFFLWGCIIFNAITRLWNLRHTKILFFLSIPLLVLIITVISQIAGFPWSIPDRFLPTRWSNNLFWLELGKQILNGILTIFRTSLTVWEKIFWVNFFYCFILAVPTVIFMWFTIMVLPPFTFQSIFWYSLIWWFELLGIIYWSHNTLYGNPPFTLWIFPTIWMILKWLLNLHMKWLKPKKYSNERGLLNETKLF